MNMVNLELKEILERYVFSCAITDQEHQALIDNHLIEWIDDDEHITQDGQALLNAKE